MSALALAAAVLDWLLDSDPALRWQAEPDLAGEVDVPPGEPSKWLTLYGTRALQQWNDAIPS